MSHYWIEIVSSRSKEKKIADYRKLFVRNEVIFGDNFNNSTIMIYYPEEGN